MIEQTQLPSLVLAPNKALAAQLANEFKQFFPNNRVEYFVSYYDYYQPEAYIPVSGTYIEKDLSINEEIEKLRLSTTSSLLSGRRDVLVVASVSCLYGIGNPQEFKSNVIGLVQDQKISRTNLMHRLVQSLYSRTTGEFSRGNFRAHGDVIDIFPGYADIAFKIHFFGDEIELIESFDPIENNILEQFNQINLYPANIFVTSPDRMQEAIQQIQNDLVKQVDYFKEIGKFLEAKRLEERTEFDLEMIRELGYCSGIENYSRYLDGRAPGTRPFCWLDYFPKDFLMIVDESHVTISQVHAMYGGDRSRKENLVDYGFRLPAAMDNRPLRNILKGSYDDTIVFNLPKGEPPYRKDEAPKGFEPSNLHKQSKRFKYFFKGGQGDNILAVRREKMFIDVLESLHPDEAELVLTMKEKKLMGKYSGCLLYTSDAADE